MFNGFRVIKVNYFHSHKVWETIYIIRWVFLSKVIIASDSSYLVASKVLTHPHCFLEGENLGSRHTHLNTQAKRTSCLVRYHCETCLTGHAQQQGQLEMNSCLVADSGKKSVPLKISFWGGNCVYLWKINSEKINEGFYYRARIREIEVWSRKNSSCCLCSLAERWKQWYVMVVRIYHRFQESRNKSVFFSINK